MRLCKAAGIGRCLRRAPTALRGHCLCRFDLLFPDSAVVGAHRVHRGGGQDHPGRPHRGRKRGPGTDRSHGQRFGKVPLCTFWVPLKPGHSQDVLACLSHITWLGGPWDRQSWLSPGGSRIEGSFKGARRTILEQWLTVK